MVAVKGANLGLRFLLELWVLGAVGYWGYQVGASRVLRLVLAGGLPLVVAVIWGMLVAPKASVALPPAVRLALELAIFGLGVVALAAAGQRRLAVGLAVTAVVNRGLMFVWHQ